MSKKFLYLFKEGHDAFGGDQTTMNNMPGYLPGHHGRSVQGDRRQQVPRLPAHP